MIEHSSSAKQLAHSLTKMNGALIDIELYQTRYCSRLMRKSCYIECMLSLDHINGEFIEVRACAPELWREELFYFVQDVYSLLECVIGEACPNLNLERHYLNFKPVRVIQSSTGTNMSGTFAPDTLMSPNDVIIYILNNFFL